MAIDKLFPKLEWNPRTISGIRTIGSPIITGIASTATVIVGMIATATGFAADSIVLSKTADSITLDNNAASSNAATSVALIQRFEFNYPPSKDTDKEIDPQEKVTTSLSGKRQVQIDYLEEKRGVTFQGMTDDEFQDLKMLFYVAWAVYGNEFKYFPDKADSSYDTYELSTFKHAPIRQAKKHPSFIYGLAMVFRKVI